MKNQVRNEHSASTYGRGSLLLIMARQDVTHGFCGGHSYIRDKSTATGSAPCEMAICIMVSSNCSAYFTVGSRKFL